MGGFSGKQSSEWWGCPWSHACPNPQLHPSLLCSPAVVGGWLLLGLQGAVEEGAHGKASKRPLAVGTVLHMGAERGTIPCEVPPSAPTANLLAVSLHIAIANQEEPPDTSPAVQCGASKGQGAVADVMPGQGRAQARGVGGEAAATVAQRLGVGKEVAGVAAQWEEE